MAWHPRTARSVWTAARSPPLFIRGWIVAAFGRKPPSWSLWTCLRRSSAFARFGETSPRRRYVRRLVSEGQAPRGPDSGKMGRRRTPPSGEFTNEDVYAFERELEQLHPDNPVNNTGQAGMSAPKSASPDKQHRDATSGFCCTSSAVSGVCRGAGLKAPGGWRTPRRFARQGVVEMSDRSWTAVPMHRDRFSFSRGSFVSSTLRPALRDCGGRAVKTFAPGQ